MGDFFDGLANTDPGNSGAFAQNPIARWSEGRAADSVATALAEGSARFYLFRDGKALTRGTDALFTVREAENLGADLGAAVLLGWHDGHPRLAANLPDAPAETNGVSLTTLRALAMEARLAPEDLGGLAHAQGLLNWHGRHRFCSNCGAETAMARGGYRRDCRTCGAEHFPRTDPVVIMLAVAGEAAVLGRKAQFPPGSYSCLAGFMEPGETIEDAVRRETLEESGIRVGRVRYFASQPWPFPSSLMIGAHGEALSREIVRDQEELEDCRWFSRAEVRQMLTRTHPEKLMTPPPMAIAHHIIAVWAKG